MGLAQPPTACVSSVLASSSTDGRPVLWARRQKAPMGEGLQLHPGERRVSEGFAVAEFICP